VDHGFQLRAAGFGLEEKGQMERLKERFDEVVAKIRALPASGPAQLSNDLKLKLYGFFRQARDGDAEGERPGLFDLVGRLKYDAWASNRGVNADHAMRRYIAEVEAFAREHGVEL